MTERTELTHSRRQILDSSRLKEFADDNFRFYENGRKLSKRVENWGKRRNARYQQFLLFPTVFSKGLFPTGVKKCHCVGMGKVLQDNSRNSVKNVPRLVLQIVLNFEAFESNTTSDWLHMYTIWPQRIYFIFKFLEKNKQRLFLILYHYFF